MAGVFSECYRIFVETSHESVFHSIMIPTFREYWRGTTASESDAVMQRNNRVDRWERPSDILADCHGGHCIRE